MSGNRNQIAAAVIVVLAIVAIYFWNKQSTSNSAAVTAASPVNANTASAPTPSPSPNPGPQHKKWPFPWNPHGPRPTPPPRQWPNSNLSQRGLSQSGVDRDRIADAEREAWYAADADVEKFATDPAAASHTADSVIGGDSGGLDYVRYTTDMIVDPRMQENHRKWVEEMGPWSGALRNVDNLDEALESSTHFTGLQRPQAVPVYNPTQVTELGPEIFAGNHKFRFNG